MVTRARHARRAVGLTALLALAVGGHAPAGGAAAPPRVAGAPAASAAGHRVPGPPAPGPPAASAAGHRMPGPPASGAPTAAGAGAAAPASRAAVARRRTLVTRRDVAAARTFAAQRAGTVAWAVGDGRRPIRGTGVARAFESASVSKAMLLVAALRGAAERDLSAQERALLDPMIRRSDNRAASAVYPRVGGLAGVARLAGMTHFTDVGYWSDAKITAADQVRLFRRIGALLPERHRAYGLGLLSSVVSYQRWGIADVADRRGFPVRFKGGWRSGLAHQVARVELPGTRRHVEIAVLTTGAPSRAYSEATMAGIADRLLPRAVQRGRVTG